MIIFYQKYKSKYKNQNIKFIYHVLEVTFILKYSRFNKSELKIQIVIYEYNNF